MRHFAKRKLAAAGISMMLVLGLWGCAQKGNGGKTLYERGLEMVSLMEEMADSDAYLSAYSSNGDILEVMETVREGDFSEPKAVYRITVPEDAFLKLMELAGEEGIEDMSDTLKDSVRSRMNGAMISMINARGGATAVAAMSICTGSKIFVSSELEGDAIYLYIYENAVPVAVSFVPGEDGAVLAAGYFILNEDFQGETAEDIKEYVSLFGEISPEVELVEQ